MIFTTVFLGCFHFWLHLFMSPTFFTMTAFLLLFYQVLYFCVVVRQVLRIWESIFYALSIFTFHSFPTFAPLPGFLGSRQFFIEGCKASHKSWKIRPVLSVCLNHTVFRKINYSVDSIHVLSPYGTLYQPLQGFELTIY